MSAMFYKEQNKVMRVGIQKHNPSGDIVESWSTVTAWLRSLLGDINAIEVYPCDGKTLNTAPVRWFWIVDEIPYEFDLLNFRS